MSKMEENLDDVIASLIDFDEDEGSSATKTNEASLGANSSSEFSKGEALGDPSSQALSKGDLSSEGLTMGDPVILLTEHAAQEIRRIMQAESLDEKLRLRVAVEGGGCSGLSYKLGFDHKTEDDLVCESQGLEIIIDPRHALYLDRCEIDYPQGLDARGFVFTNPNASESCGCGTSFAV